MGGVSKSSSTQQSGVQLTPEQIAQTNQQVGNLVQAQNKQSGFLDQLQQNAAQLRNTLSPAGQLDNVSKQLIGVDRQDISNSLNNQVNQISQRFGTGPLGKILTQQATANATLAANPLALKAQQGQSARQAQDLNNQQSIINQQAQLSGQDLQGAAAGLGTIAQAYNQLYNKSEGKSNSKSANVG